MQRAQRSARGSLDDLPSCPRATHGFVGREMELARLAELVDHAVLFLIYGVAGIGKSEFAFRAVEVVSERPGWDQATPTFVQVHEGMDEQHLVAVLRLRTGVQGAPSQLGGPPRSHTDELESVVRALNARPRILVIDDCHLLDPGVAARILGHLARHVRASRIIATTRLELALPAETTTPVVTRLAPLDQTDARQMLAHLSRRLGVAVGDASGILERAGGSPFFLQREIVSSFANASGPPDDPLDATLRALPVAARRLLLRVAVVSGRISATELDVGKLTVASGIATLARHFFIDPSDGNVVVHDLVRGAVLRLAAPAEIARAHRLAARLLDARSARGGAEGALAAVEAVRHLCLAGDHEDALSYIITCFGRVSSAGLDHLLVGSLEELRTAAPDRASAVDMILARVFVRRALIPQAQGALARLAEADDGSSRSVHYLTLAATVASQRGDLRAAEAFLQSARQVVTTGKTERIRIALNLANVLSLGGDTTRARDVLEEVHEACEELGGRTVLRWGWSFALSYSMQQSFAQTVATVVAFRERATAMGASDLSTQFGMLEVLARAETHDVAGAREVSARIVAPAARAGALRSPMAGFYAGIAAWAEGDLRAALAALRDTWTFIEAHDHAVLRPIVGHYLARVHLALGDIRAALDLLQRTTRRAVERGLRSVTSVGHALYARALVEAGEAREAQAQAHQALGADNSATHVHARVITHQAMALALALDGDLPSARAHLEQAQLAAGPGGAEQIDILLDRAETELCGGEPAGVVEAASAARNHFAARGRRFLEARACVALASGHAALGGPGDLVMADEALARADELCARYGYNYLKLRAELARAAVAARRGDRAAADHILSAALAGGDAQSTAAGGGKAGLLLGCALGSARDRELPTGLAAELTLLGLRGTATRRADVVVDLDSSTLASARGVVKGRPVLCALLACLIDNAGHPVPADLVYRTVWGANEYHPLRHRNTLYVTMNRLRQALTEVCPDHVGEIIVTLPSGWRLADGFVARKTR